MRETEYRTQRLSFLLVCLMLSHLLQLLDAISSLRELKQVHALIIKRGLTQHLLLLNKLVICAALPSWGSLEYAVTLFHSAAVEENTVLCNTMIRAYSQSIFSTEAVHLYNQMSRGSIITDNLTYPFVLKACGRVSAAKQGQPEDFEFARKGAEIHCRIHRSGLDRDTFVQNSLIFMYSQCGRLIDARHVFDQMVERTVVSWNTMMVAYDRSNDFDSADHLFRRMPKKNVVSWNTLLTRYARLGDVESARRIFWEMPERDSISWNSMIAGYVKVEDYESALILFEEMQAKLVKLTETTVILVFRACAETGSLEMGEQIHRFLEENSFKIEGFLGNVLVDMYAKCGDIRQAKEVFDGMDLKHISSWNSMIVALAVHGHCEEALELFCSMEKELKGTVKPDHITFLGVLLACSHNGQVTAAQGFFHRMVEEYKMKPDIKHYGCMIDMLSRGGLLDEAFELIKAMPCEGNSVLWRTLLGACRIHGHVELAEEAFRKISEMEIPNYGDCILLSNLYVKSERWEDAERLRVWMIRSGISKYLACSQIEVN